MTTLAEMDDRVRALEEEKLTEFIATQINAFASGRNTTECILNSPHDQYFIGNLRAAPLKNEDASQLGWIDEVMDKLAPAAFGAEFRIQPNVNAFTIEVQLHWACYYRVFPTLEQQLAHQTKRNNNNVIQENTDSAEKTVLNSNGLKDAQDEDSQAEASPEALVTAKDRRSNRFSTDTLFVRFKKILCKAIGTISIRIDITDGAEWIIDTTDLQNSISKEIARVQAAVLADPENLRTNGSQNEYLRIPDTILNDTSGKEYTNFCKMLKTQVVPEWKWSVDVAPPRISDVVNEPNERLLMIEFTNVTPMSEKSPNVEPFVFDVEASFVFTNCTAKSLEFDLAPRGFRYDPLIPARGFNCNIRRATEEENVDFITTNMPFYHQMRYQTQNRPKASFADLAQQPLPVLETILKCMQEYLEEWDKQSIIYSKKEWWKNTFQAEYENDRQKFEDEIKRFALGLQIIRDNVDVHLAFQLTNETFRRSDPRKTAWRLFQIVFLVSQIPGIAALADSIFVESVERKIVDIIYFPTGGGKTEAYLSVIAFHCFFDRLRGKTAGVTAWTRFPLRLLTLQQTQRVADVIGMAEIVRKEQSSEPRLSGAHVTGFAVGYFVGSNATPNKLAPPYGDRYPEPEWDIANDVDERQRWKRIIRCPSCRTDTVVVDFTAQDVRLRHRCTQPTCKFEKGYLPVYVVDNEIYRYLPAVIVGTIDKLAGIGNQHKMSLILGKVAGFCKLHGYYSGKCSQDECNDQAQLVLRVPDGLSGPTLFVQDELHLLKEGLGTFDAHYETFVQHILKEFGQDYPLKIIASSATIEAFERQVEHLYGRYPKLARVFPGLGPTLQTSFYAETLDYPQRIFLGIIPHNKTIFNAILELIQYYHEVVQTLQLLPKGEANPYDGDIMPGTQDWQVLLDFYAMSMTYFLNTRDLYSIKTDLEGDVNVNLERSGFRGLSISELTGSVSTSEVAKILERMERLLAQPKDIVDTILATNMVSHGVDIDRLNSMIFYGMPAQVAEYIQSSSRVGRTHVGLVFMCLHPVHERDQSHYVYFSKFHEFLGQLVEPVAINRWSKFSVQRTLPGLFMAILLQLLANQSGEKSPGRYTRLDFVKKQIREGKIREENFISFLEEAYQVVGVDSPGANAFRQEIELRVGQFFDQILAAVPPTEWVSDALFPPPMTSLRDVDEQLIVELDDTGTRWASSHS